LLRQWAEDANPDERHAAMKALQSSMEALANSSRPEALPLLHELTRDQNSEVREVAMKALESFSGPEALPMLHELA
jgi:HEAT repeat protein